MLSNRAAESEIVEQAYVVEQILAWVVPSWRTGISDERSKNAFSLAAKQGEVRLRLMPDGGGDTFRSVHREAMAFAEGCYAGIRNPNPQQPRGRPPRAARARSL
ncbi:hypothetical protein [Streptomyces jumonjinensis]|uniref:Uncharacterized protein n=1 Tax=Streptomyces jumonjinensis TaxID=1945 RepID=A0A646KSW4_STRJU|nr:hypothetical protein [Streptomyces jumonjinensis]MQT05325.1 hypothetical protein [Streptomyces jumonjinensis]